jgi:hypothetical protein
MKATWNFLRRRRPYRSISGTSILPTFARRCLFISLLFAYASSAYAQSQLLEYGPFKGYGIGKGIRGNDYEKPLAACIKGTEAPLAASGIKIVVSIVSSEDEYKQAFHIDQKAEASFLGIGGGGEELHFGQQNSGVSTAFDIIVEAYGEHDSQTLNNVQWDPNLPYKAMLDSGDPSKIQQVRNACGDRYIETVFNEVRLFAVLHVSKQQNSTLTTFSGSAHGKVDLPIAAASASLGGDGNVSSAHQSGAVTVDIYTEGFTNSVNASAAAIGIATADGLQAVADKLTAFLARLDEKGQPVKYLLSTMPLPLPAAGDLDDMAIFDSLKELKRKYLITYFRLQNLKSLSQPPDPRRVAFRQPQADEAIRLEQGTLTAYLNAVEKAHQGCREALIKDVCQSGANTIGTPPHRVSVELPEVGPPVGIMYGFVINGVPLLAGRENLLIQAPGTTLLNAARSLQSNASNVDLLMPILGGDYLSFIDVQAALPNSNFPQLVVGGHRLLGQDLNLPAYWKGSDDRGIISPSSVLHVMHADMQHPCNTSASDVGPLVDESCLTNVGRVLRDVALADAAQLVIQSGHLPNYNFVMTAATTNCFGQVSIMTLADLHVGISPNGNEVKVKVDILLRLANFLVPLIDKEESHDLETWKRLAQTRLTSLLPSGNGPIGSGPSLCAPHIP